MIRRLLVVALLAGCAQAPSPARSDDWRPPDGDQPSASGFDARKWANEVKVALADSTQLTRWNLEAGPLWDVANAHLQLDRACDTFYDGDSLVYDPLPLESNFNDERRGLMEVQRLGSDESIVIAQCTYAAYQGTYLLIHVEGDQAALLSALVSPGKSEQRAPLLSLPGTVTADRHLSTFSKARGLADCGVYTTYQIGLGADLQILNVRQRECSDDIPDEIAPETWPVVYRATG